MIVQIEDNGQGEAVISGAFHEAAMPYAIVSNGIRYVREGTVPEGFKGPIWTVRRRYGEELEQRDVYDVAPSLAVAESWAEEYSHPRKKCDYRAVRIYVETQQEGA